MDPDRKDCSLQARRTGARSLFLFAAALLLNIFWLPPVYGSEYSPYRNFYPDIDTISTSTLYEKFWLLTLVDVRSPFEFDVVHITTSVNLPLESEGFSSSLAKFRPLKDEIELVFIDNSPNCSRAFKAARIARSMGLENVFVYDAGISFWMYLFPDKSRLMGTSPAQAEQVLPLNRYQIRLVSHEQFLQLAEKKNSLVIDTRDIFHRRDIPRDLEIRNITFESLLEAINNRVWSEKKLLIFDSDGSTTRLLQIFLQAGGYYDYHFLDGGINAVPPESLRPVFQGFSEQVSVNQVRLLGATSHLWHIDHCPALLNYIISSLRFKNYAFIDPGQAAADLTIDNVLLRSLSEKLAESGHTRFLEINGNFIYQIDPLIAWKGEMGGIIWRDSISQYHP